MDQVKAARLKPVPDRPTAHATTEELIPADDSVLAASQRGDQ
jgi:hypothetical protein